MSNSNNWLGFSLSPHGGHVHGGYDGNNNHHHHATTPPISSPSSSSPLPCNYFLSPQGIASPRLCFGIETENASLYSSSHPHNLSFMPLKSDGSLYMIDAFPRSHNQGVMPCQDSPKLEDFMGTHHIESNNNNEREIETMSFLNFNQNPRETSFDSMQMHRQNPNNYFGPLDGVVLYQPQLDWPSYSAYEQQGVVYNGDIQSLNLSMSNGSHMSGCVSVSTGTNDNALEASSRAEELVALEKKSKKRVGKGGAHKQSVNRKSVETFGQRTSQYRGVTRHRWTGRYEAHLWDNSCKKEGQTRKGRQVYLGGYDNEEKAARSYDLAALKYWGPSTHINFSVETYKEELEIMKNMSRQEYVAHLRRRSSGFSRGASIYRGVTRHHQHGRWQARIGRVAGNKDLYLGTFSTQEEAAEAYDIAAIKFRGGNAVTNFEITRYNVEQIMSSNTLLPMELAKRTKEQTVHTKKPEGKIANVHMSNSSSLVTSLSTSRDGSTERTNNNVVYSNYESSRAICNMVPVNSWNPTEGQIRQSSNLAHLPVFAAWADA